MKTSLQPAKDQHQQFRDELIAVLRKHGDKISAMEMLALASHLVGQIIAMQDQRTVTPDMAMKIVSQNIEQGNREVLDGLGASSGSS